MENRREVRSGYKGWLVRNTGCTSGVWALGMDSGL